MSWEDATLFSAYCTVLVLEGKDKVFVRKASQKIYKGITVEREMSNSEEKNLRGAKKEERKRKWSGTANPKERENSQFFNYFFSPF